MSEWSEICQADVPNRWPTHVHHDKPQDRGTVGKMRYAARVTKFESKMIGFTSVRAIPGHSLRPYAAAAPSSR